MAGWGQKCSFFTFFRYRETCLFRIFVFFSFSVSLAATVQHRIRLVLHRSPAPSHSHSLRSRCLCLSPLLFLFLPSPLCLSSRSLVSLSFREMTRYFGAAGWGCPDRSKCQTGPAKSSGQTKRSNQVVKPSGQTNMLGPALSKWSNRGI